MLYREAKVKSIKDGIVEFTMNEKPVFANESEIVVINQVEKEKTKPLTGAKNKKVVVSKIENFEVEDTKEKSKDTKETAKS